VSSSTRVPQRTHRGWPDTIPYNIHKEVGYRPTQRHVKLLSLGIPYAPYALVHFKCLFIWTQPMRALLDTGGGYHLGAPNFISDHSSSFPSSILHFLLIASLGLELCHSINYSSSQHSTLEPGIKALNLMSGVCHSTSTEVLSIKHSTTNRFSTTIGAR
jgi:hypothetical protein